MFWRVWFSLCFYTIWCLAFWMFKNQLSFFLSSANIHTFLYKYLTNYLRLQWSLIPSTFIPCVVLAELHLDVCTILWSTIMYIIWQFYLLFLNMLCCFSSQALSFCLQFDQNVEAIFSQYVPNVKVSCLRFHFVSKDKFFADWGTPISFKGLGKWSRHLR